MQTENKTNETDLKIADAYRNDGSQIAGLGHVAGCIACTGCRSNVTHEEQKTAIDQTGKPTAATGLDNGPVRLKKPIAAIREAKRRAVIWGFSVADVTSKDNLPYDFVATREGITSFVCVRRVNSSCFNIDMITTRCKKQITAFRSMDMQQGLIFEIWVRGYARAFYRYRVLPDTIEETGIVLEPETRAGKKVLHDAMTKTTQTERADEKVVGDMSLTIG
jgi:hypothetical protein